ncbi:MAG: hypothetical protein ABJJ53_12880 [Sulfitobacter sp.]
MSACTSWVLRAAMVGILSPLFSTAQAETRAPLSVIDWLDKPAPRAQLPRAPVKRAPSKPQKIDEPAVTNSGSAPVVTTRPLGAIAPRNIGLVPPSVTGMKPDLWAGSDVHQLARTIGALPELELPAANALLFTLMLTEVQAPSGGTSASNALTRARVEKLMALGVVDPALALIEQAGAEKSVGLFDLWAQLSLLVGTEDTACGVLSRASYLTKDPALRIFCDARRGDWENAALALGSSKALKLLPPEKLNLLERFLNPDVFEDAPPLAAPRNMDPLTFRLFETIGEPLPTGPLPRTYAVADLRDIAGWKSQIEAAERLTRVGALPDNRLLGLYTDRKASASGGVWDHVRAVQHFDTALGTGSADAVAKTLPAAWRQMQQGRLEVSFSTAFHDRLSKIKLSGNSAVIQARMGLLSPSYETTAMALDAAVPLGRNGALIRAIAKGAPAQTAPTAALPRAIHDAFVNPTPRPARIKMAKTQQLGEALLATLEGLHDGANGDSRALREALGTLRALGLEDTARRAALQILLLDHAT